jgi:hypothetical protein
MILTLDNTKVALARYDAGQPARDAYLDAAQTDGEVYRWMLDQKIAADEVREAFFEDTKDRNSHDNCMIVEIAWLRELVS